MSRNDLSLFNNFDLFDPFFGDGFFAPERDFKHQPREFLRCDVVENEKDYEIVMDAPGVKKENIQVDVEDGYLTIEVTQSENRDEKKKNFIRKERHAFIAKRSFYVGDIKEENVKASLTEGELHITVPKEEPKVINKKHIEIA